MRKLTHQEIVHRQKNQIKKKRVPLIIVLDNIRSLHNVGSIFRTADGVGVEKLWLCGITGFPPHPQIAKIALGAESQVPWDHADSSLKIVQGLKEQGYHIVLLEQMDQSVDYDAFVPHKPTCLVVGNEMDGISDDLVPWADASVHIEMMGIKNSLNVSVALGIVAFHLSNHLKTKRIV